MDERTIPPFSLRLTFEERAKLERDAAGMALGAYMRSRLRSFWRCSVNRDWRTM